VTQKTYADDPYRHPRGADGLLVTAPKMAGGHTLFVAVGNLFAYLCLAGTLGLLSGALVRAHRLRYA